MSVKFIYFVKKKINNFQMIRVGFAIWKWFWLKYEM